MAASSRRVKPIAKGKRFSGPISKEVGQILSRKQDYIRICAEKDVRFSKTSGFERYEFEHQALPEINLQDIDPSLIFFGKKFKVPFFIEALTGGAPGTEKINRNLAAAAEEVGIGMGLGSQRAMLKDPGVTYTYQVRDVAPNIFLLGNIGAVQLSSFRIEEITAMVQNVQADGLAIHLNPAQEICQPEGDTDWRHILENITRVCRESPFPVFVKETGCGLNREIARRLETAGVSGLDVAGAGGTSMNKVEFYRGSRTAEAFCDWGIPTADSLKQCREAVQLPLIASGGIRTGLDCAKAMAMGASLVGFAWPLLKPALKSPQAVVKKLSDLTRELIQTMLLVGARDIPELQKTRIHRRDFPFILP